jgi:adenylate cyclase
MIPKQFLPERRRRHVYNVAVGYAVIAWPLIQIAIQIAPLFDVPRCAVRVFVFVVVFVGFPIAVAVASTVDLKRDGMPDMKEPAGELGTNERTRKSSPTDSLLVSD